MLICKMPNGIEVELDAVRVEIDNENELYKIIDKKGDVINTFCFRDYGDKMYFYYRKDAQGYMNLITGCVTISPSLDLTIS